MTGTDPSESSSDMFSLFLVLIRHAAHKTLIHCLTVVISRIFCYLVNFFEFVFKLFYYCSSQSAGLFFFLSVIWVWQQQRGFFNWSRFLHKSARKIIQPQKSPQTTFKSRLVDDSRLVCKSGKHSIWFKIQNQKFCHCLLKSDKSVEGHFPETN